MSGDLVWGDVAVGMALPLLEKKVKPVTVVLGAMASRDWRPQHHDYRFATEQGGLDDIIMNTPNLAAWFERYLTDWTGPKGRLGRIRFRMKDSIYPGETMRFSGIVKSVEPIDADLGWIDVAIELRADEKSCVDCDARIAVPRTAEGNPWKLRGDAWRP
jgi:acyl dehydratase